MACLVNVELPVITSSFGSALEVDSWFAFITPGS
jgi:hypothetical protein